MAAREIDKVLRWPDEDLLSDDTNDPGAPALQSAKSHYALFYKGFWGRHRNAVVAGVAGVLIVVGVIAAVTTKGAAEAQKPAPAEENGELRRAQQNSVEVTIQLKTCNYEENSLCPAGDLFLNPQVQEVVTENLMRVGGILRPDDKHLVRASVATGFMNMSFEIQKRAPHAHVQLGVVQLNETQKDLILAALRLMSAERVLELGQEVGEAIHNSDSSNPDVVLRSLEHLLRPRLEELRDLQEELVPERLRAMWRRAAQWEMTLAEENLRIMGPFRRGKFMALHNSGVYGAEKEHEELSSFKKRTYGILGGVLEQGRALLHIIKLCAHVSGRSLDVPAWVTSLGGNLDVNSQDLNCEHDFEKAEEIQLTKALFCPLKFGTQGLEALMASDSM